MNEIPRLQDFAQIRRGNALWVSTGGFYFGKLGDFYQRELPGVTSTGLGRQNTHSYLCGNRCHPQVSELLDRGFRFQQDRDAIANGINALTLVALQAVFATQHKRLAADGARKDFQQLWADHDHRF